MQDIHIKTCRCLWAQLQRDLLHIYRSAKSRDKNCRQQWSPPFAVAERCFKPIDTDMIKQMRTKAQGLLTLYLHFLTHFLLFIFFLEQQENQIN
jgi:hypothetical protein